MLVYYHLDVNQQHQQQQKQRNQSRNQPNNGRNQQRQGGGLNQRWRDTVHEPFKSRWDDDEQSTRPLYDYSELNESNPWL